jgi:cytochrome c biogenesis protein CcmG/thiol:disulfide interchange protein DsbE
MNRFVVPLGIFVVLLAFLFVGLKLNPREIPSPLIGKPVPAFQLAELDAPGQTFGPHAMRGQVWLLNVWASWCVSCREEHPLLVELAQSDTVTLVGLNYKDEPAAAREWLGRLGNPYRLSVTDPDGRVGIDFGVYGVPETFVIDKAGVIRYKQIGPITTEALEETILPLVKELQKG